MTFRHSICNEAFEKWPFAKACQAIRKIGYTGIELAPYTLGEKPTDVTPAQRAEFSKKSATSPWSMQFSGMPDATMTRLMNYVFGNGELTPADAEFAGKMFPLKIDAVSGQNITISTAEQCGPTAAPG